MPGPRTQRRGHAWSGPGKARRRHPGRPHASRPPSRSSRSFPRPKEGERRGKRGRKRPQRGIGPRGRREDCEGGLKGEECRRVRMEAARWRPIAEHVQGVNSAGAGPGKGGRSQREGSAACPSRKLDMGTPSRRAGTSTLAAERSRPAVMSDRKK